MGVLALGQERAHVGSGVIVVMRNEEQAARAESLELDVFRAM